MLDKMLSVISGIDDADRCDSLRKDFCNLIDREMRKFYGEKLYKDEQQMEELNALVRISEKINDINLFPSILESVPPPPPGFVPPPPPPPGFVPPPPPGFVPPPPPAPPLESPQPPLKLSEIKEGIVGINTNQIHNARQMLERDTKENLEERNEHDSK